MLMACTTASRARCHRPAAHPLREEEPAESDVHGSRSPDQGYHHRGQRVGAGACHGGWKGGLGQVGPDYEQPRERRLRQCVSGLSY